MPFNSLTAERRSTVFLANLKIDFVIIMSILPDLAADISALKPGLSALVPVKASS